MSGNDGGFVWCTVLGTAPHLSLLYTEIFKLQDWNKTSEIKGAQKVKNLFLKNKMIFFFSCHDLSLLLMYTIGIILF